MTAPTGISLEEGAFPNNPYRRVGRPEELVGAVTYLLSDDASYTTGSENRRRRWLDRRTVDRIHRRPVRQGSVPA